MDTRKARINDDDRNTIEFLWKHLRLNPDFVREHEWRRRTGLQAGPFQSIQEWRASFRGRGVGWVKNVRDTFPDPDWTVDHVMEYLLAYDAAFFNRPEWRSLKCGSLMPAVSWTEVGAENNSCAKACEKLLRLRRARTEAIRLLEFADWVTLRAAQGKLRLLKGRGIGSNGKVIWFNGPAEQYRSWCVHQLEIIEKNLRVFLTEHSRMHFVIDTSQPRRTVNASLDEAWRQIQELRMELKVPAERKSQEPKEWQAQLDIYVALKEKATFVGGRPMIDDTVLKALFKKKWQAVFEKSNLAMLDRPERKRPSLHIQEPTSTTLGEFEEQNRKAWNAAQHIYKNGMDKLRRQTSFAFSQSFQRIQDVFSNSGTYRGRGCFILVPILFYLDNGKIDPIIY